jgi:hypothetical protein
MKRTTKILITILICATIYSFYRAFTGQGGSGLYDFFDAVTYSSVILFLVSLTILIANIRNYKKHWDTALFLILGLPLTYSAVGWTIGQYQYNRTPDLTAKYALPVTREQYLVDSVNIKLTIDSLVVMRNNKHGGPDVVYAIIDTIIYSEKGNKVFVSYIKKFERNDLGNYLDTDYLVADSRDSIFWSFTDPRYSCGGSYPDIGTLKLGVRKRYFNQFTFLDRDSTAENYFWKVVL